MKLLTAEEILAADDSQAEIVAVPEWGGSVRLRGLSADERISLAVSSDDPKAPPFAVRVLGMSLCNEKGERLFPDDKLAALKAKNGAVFERLFLEAQRISKLGAKQAEQTAGKSEAAPTSSSPSD